MILQQGTDRLSRQGVLDRPAGALQIAVKRAYQAAGPVAGRRIADALHGVWLGHPLHPLLTDIVIGAWTTGGVFDALELVSGHRAFARAADTALALGTAASVPTVLAGLTDWQYTRNAVRRTGLVHAVLNIGTSVLQGVSLLARLLGARRAGLALSALNLGAMSVSAYLGSEMISKYRQGVDRAPAGTQPPTHFTPVLPVDELPEGRLRRVEVAGVPILLVRQGDRILAMHETCTHMGGPLSQGRIVDGAVQCPWHGSRFALHNGRVVSGPATMPEQCLATRVRNGQIEVGPAAGLGRCEHEPVPALTPEAEMPMAPAMR